MKSRIPIAKPGQLKVGWGKVDKQTPEIAYAFGGGGTSTSDCRILCRAFEETEVFSGRSLAEELDARGYDLSTFRFSIELKRPPTS
jgi:hypothetical protein